MTIFAGSAAAHPETHRRMARQAPLPAAAVIARGGVRGEMKRRQHRLRVLRQTHDDAVRADGRREAARRRQYAPVCARILQRPRLPAQNALQSDPILFD
ncbi:MAG TPA: hypothetical protein VM755_17195 [Stellaceae bacterium]|nr:hypothetical protein [Stellaceae bacterium]